MSTHLLNVLRCCLFLLLHSSTHNNTPHTLAYHSSTSCPPRNQTPTPTQDTLVVTVMSPSLTIDDEVGRVEVPMTEIRAASQVRLYIWGPCVALDADSDLLRLCCTGSPYPHSTTTLTLVSPCPFLTLSHTTTQTKHSFFFPTTVQPLGEARAAGLHPQRLLPQHPVSWWGPPGTGAVGWWWGQQQQQQRRCWATHCA